MQSAEITFHAGSFRFCQTMRPSAAACSHLVVSIHLHWLIITKQVSPFCTPFLFLPLQLWPGRSFHNSVCAATQTVRLSPEFCRNSVSLGFHRLEEMRRRRGRERACIIRRDTQTRESESCVEAHQRRKKPDLLSPKNQLQMLARRFSFCPQ